MQIKRNHIALGLVLVIIVSAYFIFDKKQENNTNNTATTTDSNGISLDTTDSNGYTLKQISEETISTPQAKIPDLNRAIVFSSSQNIDENTKKIITDKIISLQTDLKLDPSSLTKWLKLGVYQKMAGDYIGASLSWKYITEVSPKDFISFGNLGDLYAYYLKDNGLAEVYYKKAIENAPKQIYLYTQLADVYKNVFKDLNKAKSIIDQGLNVNPANQALLEYKNNL